MFVPRVNPTVFKLPKNVKYKKNEKVYVKILVNLNPF